MRWTGARQALHRARRQGNSVIHANRDRHDFAPVNNLADTAVSSTPPQDRFEPGEVVCVVLPLPIEAAYDYAVPVHESLVLGDVVEVPLGRRFEVGVVWGPGKGDVAAHKIKPVVQRVGVPPIPDVSRAFIDWVAAYTLQPTGAVLRMTLNPARRWQPPTPPTVIAAAGPSLETAGVKPTPARQKIMAAVSKGRTFDSMSRMAKAVGVSSGVIRDLIDVGVLALRPVAASAAVQLPAAPTLEAGQRAAAGTICEKLGQGFSVTVLDGVTGSGKTEVYFEAIAKIMETGGQALVLLPEIALTAQWMARFVARFGFAPAEWHSDLSGKQRRENWLHTATGEARVVVGARSALFLPFKDLRLIVVDEEHEGAFKQEDGVIYHARDMAVVRAREGKIPIVLSSATPSLETMTNVQAGRYAEVHLPTRFGVAVLPKINVIDLKTDKPEKGPWGRAWLAPPLVKAIDDALRSGEQSLLFLNRRGYAPLTLCNSCGHRLHCPQCTAWLVEHKLTRRLQCHHCGYNAPRPIKCSSCGAADSFVACGPGIERVAEEAQARWPEARVKMVASDTLDRPSAVAELIEEILQRRIDILVGTQVLAKGHHFPNLTLVGVVDADLGLSSWDLRAAERTYQLLHQVSGRAGRAERQGRVFLQTHDPAHPVMQALVSGNDAEFYARESEGRDMLAMPPFGRLTALILSGPDEIQVKAVGEALARVAPQGEGIEVLGPAPAFMALLRGRHRHRMLLKTRRDIKPQALVKDWLERVRVPGAVRIQIDVDPYSFF
ncbi:MAG: primosomal protein N' [Rhodospirillaceae bacterium]|nr:primosomal protein N' [Rhodospirillaceae bacterium]